MCGIAGIVDARRRPTESQLEEMVATLRHRGPDASGVQLCGDAGLAHARLSIIDLAGGAQPMSNEDGTVWITFNGEIYNYLELRDDLAARGHVFRTRSDTEVIVHAFEEYGPAAVEQFNGQFALAIWDTRARALFLARDRFGKKPLYFARKGSRFIFASEMKAVLADPAVDRAIDPRALRQIQAFWCTVPPRTIFSDVSELAPGTWLLMKGGQVEVESYWRPSYQEPVAGRTEQDYADELRALLVDAVRLRMLRSDVPVGAYLSGGIDSAVTTAMIRRYTDVPLTTFSVAFEDPEFDEGPFQREAVAHLGIRDHHETVCRAEDIGRVFPEVIWHAEQPIVRTAPAPLYLLSRLVRDNGYKVVLTGEGSDEVLGGYDIFKEAKIRRFMAERPDSPRRALLLKRLYPYIPALQSQSPAYLQAFFQARPADLGSPFFSHLPRWNLASRLGVFLSDDVAQATRDYRPEEDLLGELPGEFAGWAPFCQAQYLETSGLLPGYILSSQGDRMQMANSVEGRCPFLDYRIAEFAGRLPPRLKMQVLNEKYILKRAAGDLIPPALKTRPKQPYRSMEIPSFFDTARGRARFDYVDELLSTEAIRDGGLFNPAAVARLVDKARSGGAIGVKDGMALVTILSTQLTVAQFSHELRRLPA
jgi:asparagine synthase (glutamine-hydrolysing)